MNQTELYQKCFSKIIQNSREWRNFLDFLSLHKEYDLAVLIPAYITDWETENVQENKFRDRTDFIQIDTKEEVIRKILPEGQLTSYEFELVLQSVSYLLEQYEGKNAAGRNCFGNVVYLNVESTLRILASMQDVINKVIGKDEDICGIREEYQEVGIYGKMGAVWLKENNYYRYLELAMKGKLQEIYQEVNHIANQELDKQLRKQLNRMRKYRSENSKEYQSLEFRIMKLKAEQMVLEKLVFVER